MSKRKRIPPSKEPEKRRLTRRAVLASLGIGAALPAFRGRGQSNPKPSPTKTDDEKFDEYWVRVSKMLEKRDNEKDPKEHEKLELMIYSMRTEMYMSVPDKTALRCTRTTPTPTIK
jgi:hypothetical protein